MTTDAPSLAEKAAAAKPTPPSTIDLSVIIVSWNTCDLLRACLASLFDGGLDGIANAEVWVVDNNSADGSVAMVRSEFPAVYVIANADNIGFARANNLALARSSGRFQLLLNSDTVVPPNALARLISVMEARPDAAVCSPLLLNADGSAQLCWARFPSVRDEISGAADRSQSPYPLDAFERPERRAKMEPFVVDWVGGACFLVRTAIAKSTGADRLDEAFFMYSEETDWCRRFRAAGAATLLVPSVTVTHLGGQSSRRVPAETRRRIYRSSLRLYRRLYGPIGALPVCAVATARFLLSSLKSRRGRAIE